MKVSCELAQDRRAWSGQPNPGERRHKYNFGFPHYCHYCKQCFTEGIQVSNHHDHGVVSWCPFLWSVMATQAHTYTRGHIVTNTCVRLLHIRQWHRCVALRCRISESIGEGGGLV